MWSSVATTGVLATLSVIAGHVVVIIATLRGTNPAERPEIIRALNDRFPRAIRRTSRGR